MVAAFMSKSAGRSAPGPGCDRAFVGDTHRSSDCRIEISFDTRSGKLVTHVTLGLRWGDSYVGVMTSEADCVAVRDRLKRAFL